MIDAIGFLGDFHPVAVHFPIALLPTVALLKLYGWRRPQAWVAPAAGLLLLATLGFAALAVALGLINREANGHSGEAMDTHALLGFTTLGLIALANLLHFRAAELAAWLKARRPLLARAAHGLDRVFRALLWLLKWALMILLFPLLLLYWLLRAIWRRTLARPVARLWSRGVRPPLAALVERARSRIRTLRERTPVRAPAELAFALSLGLVLVTGLKGANLSHGEGHLTRNMPAPLAALFGAEDTGQANAQLDRAYYEHRLLPAFRRSCIKCHGSEKQKAGLRLDDYEHLIASGIVDWQDPWGSELVRRLLLPRDDPAAMPPAGRSRDMGSADVGAVIAWLQGHSLESLASQSGGLPADLRQLADRLSPVADEQLARLEAIAGLRVMRLVTDTDLLVVNLSHVEPTAMEAAIKALHPLAAHVVDLSWTGRQTLADGWSLIGRMSNLRALDLSRSSVSDADLATLSALQDLQRLNLSGTGVAMSSAALQTMLPGLRTMHLPSTDAGQTEKI